MAPKPMPWFRFYSEARRDVKITKAARLAGASLLEALGFWAVILSIASESPVRGALNVTTMERFSNDDIAIECNAPLENTEKLLAAFVKLDMLRFENGGWLVVNWEKRQYSSDKSTERVREFRKNKQSNGNETFHQPLHDRFSNNNVTPPDTDTDTESESESELNTHTQNQTGAKTETGGSGVDDDETDPDYGVLCTAYEKNLGMLSPMVADTLRDDLKQYGLQNCIDAISAALKNNVRKWAYVQGILKRWATEGKTDKPRAPTVKTQKYTDARGNIIEVPA